MPYITPATTRILMNELKQILKEPVEGFQIEPDVEVSSLL